MARWRQRALGGGARVLACVAGRLEQKIYHHRIDWLVQKNAYLDDFRHIQHGVSNVGPTEHQSMHPERVTEVTFQSGNATLRR